MEKRYSGRLTIVIRPDKHDWEVYRCAISDGDIPLAKVSVRSTAEDSPRTYDRVAAKALQIGTDKHDSMIEDLASFDGVEYHVFRTPDARRNGRGALRDKRPRKRRIERRPTRRVSR